MADRSKGSMPTLFNRTNPITKLFTQFQLEVNNQLSYVFKDLPDEFKEKGAAALTAALLKMFMGAWLYNEVYEHFIGRRPAMDPLGILNETVGDLTGYELPNLIDMGYDLSKGNEINFQTEKKDPYETIKTAGTSVAENLPFVGGLIGGGRLPISSALPDMENLGKAVLSENWDPRKKRNAIAKELIPPAAYLAAPFGGGQIKKALQGINAVRKGGSYSVNSQGEDILQYPVYTDTPGETAINTARAMIFGKSSLPTAQDWVQSGFKSLGAKETAVYRGMTEAGVSGKEAYGILQELRSTDKTDTESEATAKRKVLQDSNVSKDAKAIIYYGIMANEKEQEIMDAATEADLPTVASLLMQIKDANLINGAAGKKAKYSALEAADISDKTKEAIYAAVISDSKEDEIADVLAAGMSFNDWLKFENMTAGLASDGVTTRKEKVMGVIDGMNITDAQKDTLYSAAGYKESTLDEAPWHAYNIGPSLAPPKLNLPKLKIPELKMPTLWG